MLSYYLHNFLRKLHENEKNWTERGDVLDPPLIIACVFVYDYIFRLIPVFKYVHT